MCMRLLVCLLTGFILVGCGETAAPPTDAESSVPESGPAGVTVEISDRGTDPLPDGARVTAATSVDDRDSVDRLLDEIQQVHLSAGLNDREPHGIVVLKATEVLKQTMNQPERGQQFLKAVRHLLQARFQLALNGSKEDIDQLYADAQALNDRDETSAAAAEGIYYLAKFAHARARLVRQGKTDWYVSFSRWAREFAGRFPDQSERAVSLLFGAGRSCEMAAATAQSDDESSMLRSEARLCYVQLMEGWPKEPQGREAVAVLRRLELPGKQLAQFSGPGLDGRRVSADQFVGKVTVIFFWDSESKSFKENWLPLLKKAESQLETQPFQLVGVNLDDDPVRCRESIDQLGVPGIQICFQGDDQGWNSPLVRFWGVSQSPSVWVVDQDGVVDSVDIRRKTLPGRVMPLLKAPQVARD